MSEREIQLPMLVTGVAGVAGLNAFQHFHNLFPGQVIGVCREDLWPLHGNGIIGCDITNGDQLKRLFEEYHFKSVLSCEGTCALKSCEMDPPMAQRVNVGGVRNLLDAIGQTDVRMIHLSIDLVFSGDGDGGYVETDTPDPVTVYGKTMVEAEQEILTRRSDIFVMRISLPMGISYSGHAGAIDWIQSRFKQDKPATLYFDEVRTPQYTDCMNELFEVLLTNNMSGLYHGGGQTKMSLYEIAQVVNRLGGYNPDNLQGCPRIEAGPMPPRAGDVTLDTTKLCTELGYQPFSPWPLSEQWFPKTRQWHYERGEMDEAFGHEFLASVLYHRPG